MEQDYSWIAAIFEGAFGAASSITGTVVNGQTQRVSLETSADVTTNSKSENQKTIRALIIGACVIAAVAVFGLFVYSNRRK